MILVSYYSHAPHVGQNDTLYKFEIVIPKKKFHTERRYLLGKNYPEKMFSTPKGAITWGKKVPQKFFSTPGGAITYGASKWCGAPPLMWRPCMAWLAGPFITPLVVVWVKYRLFLRICIMYHFAPRVGHVSNMRQVSLNEASIMRQVSLYILNVLY